MVLKRVALALLLKLLVEAVKKKNRCKNVRTARSWLSSKNIKIYYSFDVGSSNRTMKIHYRQLWVRTQNLTWLDM